MRLIVILAATLLATAASAATYDPDAKAPPPARQAAPQPIIAPGDQFAVTLTADEWSDIITAEQQKAAKAAATAASIHAQVEAAAAAKAHR